MQTFPASALVLLGRLMEESRHLNERASNAGYELVSLAEREALLDFISAIRDRCAELNLGLSLKLLKEWEEKLGDQSKNITHLDFARFLPELERRIRHEMYERAFLMIPVDRTEYFTQKEPLFGSRVHQKIPKAREDISEAGKCYASGRYTACVFHLMRVMEEGLQHFGAKLDVPLTDEKNWQNILDQANKAIKEFPAKSDNTKKMAAICSHLYNVKLAWRTKTMHPGVTYADKEAKRVLQAVEGFMQELAETLLAVE